MVYGSDREFNRQETSSLRAAVSGGLNTASSDLMTPLEESPEMNNVQVDFDGMVKKRKGYKTLLHRNVTASDQHSYLRGAFYIPYQMSSGRPIIIGREEGRIIFHVRQDDGTWYTVGGFNDVFGSRGVNNQFDYIIQNDGLYSRIILVSGSTVPVQIATVSSSTTYVKGGSGTAWTFPDESVSWGHVTGLPTLCIMIVDGVVEVVSAITATVSGLNASLAITSTNSYPADTYEVELMYITWQWWAEALQLRGSQFIQTVVQGTSTKTIAVPSALLQGIEPWNGGLFPLRAQSSSNYDAVFTRANPPTTAAQYTYSNGSDSDGTTPVTTSPFYLAFGAAPSSVRNVHIIRGYFLPFFAGGVQQDAGAVQVIPYYSANVGVRSSVQPPSEGGAGVGVAAIGFHLRVRSTYAVSTGAAATRVPRYITLDATSTAAGGLGQVSSEDVYHVIDVSNSELETNGYLGSNASEDSISNAAKSFSPEFPPIPRHSYAFPVAGISWFADYRRGSFPRTIGTLQGRIVLSGFRDRPMTIAFSNPYDSDAPGYYANNFDVVYSIPSVTSPFDVTLPGAANDIITNVVEFNDSLFVFTRHRVFRVHASDGGLVTYANARYSLIAEVGCNNPRSATVTDKFPVFLSPSGVYAIVPDDSSAGYGLLELSAKIRNLVQSQNETMPYTGFVVFDPGRNELYVGLSDNTSLDRIGLLLVYNTQLNSWYSYTARGGTSFQAYWAAILWDNSVSNPTSLPSVIFTTPYKYNDDDWVSVIELNQDNTPMDLHERWVYASLPYTTALPALQATFTTVNNVKEYDPNSIEFLEKAFRLSPIRDLEDCRVTLAGSLMTFGTDYIKTERGTIILTSNPGAGLSLVVEARMNYEGSKYYPVGLMSTGGKIWTPGNYTVDISGDFYRITGVTPTPSVNDVLYIGYCFPSWYVTPTFNRGTLNVKKLKQYIGYYHNEVSDLWTINDSYPDASNIGLRRVPIDVNIAVVFSNEYEGLLQTELYNEKAPTTYPNQQVKDYSRCVVPIVGQGYNIQVIHHNNSPTTFKLAGYELVATPKPGKGYSKSEEKLN